MPNEAVEYMQAQIAEGEHWYVAMLKAMSRWSLAEETIGDRRYRYLLGGEAFDWLLLAERLLDELAGLVPDDEREALLFHGHPPIEIDEEHFQELMGTPKYQAHLNYLYGVTVEEALQQAVEDEIAKERHSYVFSFADRDEATAFTRIYGHSLTELLRAFQQERGLAPADLMLLGDVKEFTYWLFKYRVKTCDGARVASDTRKGLAALSRVEAAYRSRTSPEPVEVALPRIVNR
jgi:hypothetical protein